MRKPVARAATLGVAFSIAIVIPWIVVFPEPDPKNIKHVLWKHGLYRMNFDAASDTMIGDSSREKLVLGKTKVELQERFGYLSTLSETSPYLKGCYENSHWQGADVLFIRKSQWMIVFSGDKAKELVSFKGC